MRLRLFRDPPRADHPAPPPDPVGRQRIGFAEGASGYEMWGAAVACARRSSPTPPPADHALLAHQDHIVGFPYRRRSHLPLRPRRDHWRPAPAPSSPDRTTGAAAQQVPQPDPPAEPLRPTSRQGANVVSWRWSFRDTCWTSTFSPLTRRRPRPVSAGTGSSWGARHRGEGWPE